MRNGLTKALAALAIAFVSYQAYAVAPVVRTIPNVTVTDATNTLQVSAPFSFVYPDFINLNDYVSDDGDVADIKWSYRGAGIDGRSKYRINGADPLTSVSLGGTVNPPAGNQVQVGLNLINRGEQFNPDGLAITPTIRDIVLSPFGGPNVDASAQPVGRILTTDVITLFASDGTTATGYLTPAGGKVGGTGFTVWTEKGKYNTRYVNRLSPIAVVTPIRVTAYAFSTTTLNWVSSSPIGNITYQSGTPAAPLGLCITTTAAGANLGEWVSPYGSGGGVQLTKNKVYRMRATMSTNQVTAGSVPLWDIYLQNFNPAGAGGDQAYLADYYFLDGTGSANAVKGPATGLNTFDLWYAPAALQANQWNDTTTGVFNTAFDGKRDFRLIFRILDVDGAGYGAETDSGRICLTDLSVDSFDISNMYKVGNAMVYSLNPIIPGINGVSVLDLLHDSFGQVNGTGSTKDYATSSALTLVPTDPAGWLTELTSITPGDALNPVAGTPEYGNGSSIIDNYPVNWEGSTLYQVVVTASAPDAAGQNNGPDALRLGVDAKSAEVLADSFMTTGLSRVGMPKLAAPQTYQMFFWSHNRSLSTLPEIARLRWRVEVLNSSSFNPARKTGGVRIHSVQVNKVKFPGM